jgi:hypothetical protein
MRPLSKRTAALLLLLLSIITPQLVFSQTNYCCNEPNFGSDWCHSSSCLGAGCRNEPDASGESQANYLCDDLSSCVCAGASALVTVLTRLDRRSLPTAAHFCVAATPMSPLTFIHYRPPSEKEHVVLHRHEELCERQTRRESRR